MKSTIGDKIKTLNILRTMLDTAEGITALQKMGYDTPHTAKIIQGNILDIITTLNVMIDMQKVITENHLGRKDEEAQANLYNFD